MSTNFFPYSRPIFFYFRYIDSISITNKPSILTPCRQHWLKLNNRQVCAARSKVVIKLKHNPRYRPFVRGIHRSPVDSPHKGQWRGVLMFSLVCAWINGWANNQDAGDLRRNRAHYDVYYSMNTVLDFVVKRAQMNVCDGDLALFDTFTDLSCLSWPTYVSVCMNISRTRQKGRHFADDTFKCIFMNENDWTWIKISLKLVP